MDLTKFAIDQLKTSVIEFSCIDCSQYPLRPLECNECGDIVCCSCRKDIHKCKEGIAITYRRLNKVLMGTFKRLSELFVQVDSSILEAPATPKSLLVSALEATLDKGPGLLTCPHCLSCYESSDSHEEKCGVSSSHKDSFYVCKACDPLKLDKYGKTYHLQQPSCKDESRETCSECDLKFLKTDAHDCMKELKVITKITKENELKRIEFLSLHDTFEKCKSCMQLIVSEKKDFDQCKKCAAKYCDDCQLKQLAQCAKCTHKYCCTEFIHQVICQFCLQKY